MDARVKALARRGMGEAPRHVRHLTRGKKFLARVKKSTASRIRTGPRSLSHIDDKISVSRAGFCAGRRALDRF